MTVSRRDVLLQGSVIGAGIIAANVKGIEALAQGQPPLRRSLGDLQLNDPILQARVIVSEPIAPYRFETPKVSRRCPQVLVVHGMWYLGYEWRDFLA
jgi:hypothetical protein